MDLLEQCQKLNAQGEFQKLIELVEGSDQNDRCASVISELAKAYIAMANDKKALALLEPLEDELGNDHYWNYRIATAYYNLGQEGLALHYYEQALDARPGDQDTEENIENCRNILTLPQFKANFRERTKSAWQAFANVESKIRDSISSSDSKEHAQELMRMCSSALDIALSDVAFELGKRGDKYELCLSADGGLKSLFPLVYFAQRAPESVLKHWTILVGRQPCPDCQLVIDDIIVAPDDVQMWIEQIPNNKLILKLHCPKLKETLASNEDKVWWALLILLDQTIGQINAIAQVSDLQVLASPLDEPPQKLSDLPKIMEDLGIEKYSDASIYLDNCYCSYQHDPQPDPDECLRSDVFIGTTRLPKLIDEYMEAESECIDEYHQDGIVAGFIAFPIASFDKQNRAEAILQFRNELSSYIENNATSDAITFLGGATGIYYSYLDFIAWDLPAVLDAAAEFFSTSNLPTAIYHSFRSDIGGVELWNEDDKPEINEDTGSILSKEDIEIIESFIDERSGYYGKMLSYLEDFVKQGVAEQAFTKRQAQQDLQIALWYGFACLNLDEYRYYYKAVEWMKHSEKNASGCGTWYYRYSCALMYCNRLEDALAYAEKGVEQEPDYPWIWLQVGKLRSHFGNKEGALEAVAHGLKLVPHDHEFTTLKREIESGATLEQMLYHWISPDDDSKLLCGLDEDSDSKMRAIACVKVDPQGLTRFFEIFGPKNDEYLANAPYTKISLKLGKKSIDLVFQMNEAGLSKLKVDWLKELKKNLDSAKWLSRNYRDGRKGNLDFVMVDLDYTIVLFYKFEDEDGLFRLVINNNGTQTEDVVNVSNQDNIRAPQIYTNEQIQSVDEHINKYFGPVANVLHEIVSPDIHVDINIIPPSNERDYYILTTMGMGAYQMNVPQELAEDQLERAELVIALPKSWKLDNEAIFDENWFWPIRLLKSLARLPIHCNSWLTASHTIENRTPYAPCTELCAAMIVYPQDVDPKALTVALPNGEQVNFYQVIPLYQEEMDYKLEHGFEALEQKMAGISFVINNKRKNSID